MNQAQAVRLIIPSAGRCLEPATATGITCWHYSSSKPSQFAGSEAPGASPLGGVSEWAATHVCAVVCACSRVSGRSDLQRWVPDGSREPSDAQQHTEGSLASSVVDGATRVTSEPSGFIL